MKQKCVLYVMLFILYACTADVTYEGIKIPINNKNLELIKLDTLIDSVKIVQLSAKNQSYLTKLTKIVILNNNYYILDGDTHTIKKYNNEGELLLDFDREGRANNEYISIEDITYDVNNIYLLCDNGEKLFTLDYNLNVKNVLRLKKLKGLEEAYLDRICSYKDKLLIYEDYTKTIFSLSLQDHKIEEILIDERRIADGINSSPVFHRIDDDVVFIQMINSDNIYKLEDDKISKWGTLDFPNKDLIYTKLNNTKLEHSEKLKYWAPCINNVFKQGKFYYFTHNQGLTIIDEGMMKGKEFRYWNVAADINDVVPWEKSVHNKLYYFINLHQDELEEESIYINDLFHDRFNIQVENRYKNEDDDYSQFLYVFRLKD